MLTAVAPVTKRCLARMCLRLSLQPYHHVLHFFFEQLTIIAGVLFGSVWVPSCRILSLYQIYALLIYANVSKLCACE